MTNDTATGKTNTTNATQNILSGSKYKKSSSEKYLHH